MKIKSVTPARVYDFGVDISLDPAEAFILQVLLGEVNRTGLSDDCIELLGRLEHHLRQARVNGHDYDPEH